MEVDWGPRSVEREWRSTGKGVRGAQGVEVEVEVEVDLRPGPEEEPGPGPRPGEETPVQFVVAKSEGVM